MRRTARPGLNDSEEDVESRELRGVVDAEVLGALLVEQVLLSDTAARRRVRLSGGGGRNMMLAVTLPGMRRSGPGSINDCDWRFFLIEDFDDGEDEDEEAEDMAAGAEAIFVCLECFSAGRRGAAASFLRSARRTGSGS